MLKKYFSKITILKLTILTALLYQFVVPGQILAAEYSWLKTKNYEKIFVYSDFSECNVIADRLNESVKRSLLNANIKPFISNSLVFQMTDQKGSSVKELLDNELITDNKIILHIYGKCIEYRSAYIYQFDIHFGKIENKISQALLYSSPHYSVMGMENKIGMERIFRTLLEDVVSAYLSANKTK